MTEDCPGFDRDRRVCLVRPRDCEFAPDEGVAASRPGTGEAPDAGRDAGPSPQD